MFPLSCSKSVQRYNVVSTGTQWLLQGQTVLVPCLYEYHECFQKFLIKAFFLRESNQDCIPCTNKWTCIYIANRGPEMIGIPPIIIP